MDEELALACQGKFEEENSKSTVVLERRRLTWERLETAAGAGFRPASSGGVGVSGLENATATCVVSC